MIGLIIRWVINALAIGITAQIINGIEAHSIMALFVAALVLGILNALLRPIFLFLTLPLNILSLGLFTFVINAFLLWMTGRVVSGFEVRGFLAAFIGSILLAIVSTVFNYILSDRGRVESVSYTHLTLPTKA